MKRSYLLIYSDLFGRNRVSELIDSIDLITDWRFELPNCFFLISESTAEELYKRMTKDLAPHRMLIVEYSKNSQGWLSKEAWHLLEHKSRRKKDSKTESRES